jgi:hypothetical protein
VFARRRLGRRSAIARGPELDLIQLLEHIEQQGDELDGEDQDLWNAVLAHQQYRSEHSDEALEVFDTPDPFLYDKLGLKRPDE